MVVVGAGIRGTEQLLPLFELIVNLIHRHAPQAAIAFNTSGTDSVETAQRRLQAPHAERSRTKEGPTRRVGPSLWVGVLLHTR